MRLNLQAIIHVPGRTMPFDFSLDMSEVDIYGEQPITQPLRVSGLVRHNAGA